MKKRTARLMLVAAAFVLSLLMVVPAWAAEKPVGSSKSVRIHVLPFNDTDAIIVECDGRFGIVDSGEDNDCPSGSDSRYPLRPTVVGGFGHEAEVSRYLKHIGVTVENLEFYIGTHPHSDHIGSADEIIREFRPKSIYTPYYEDDLVTRSANLWDNLYVYDHLVNAAQWAQESYGARFVQHLDPLYVDEDDASSPDEGASQLATQGGEEDHTGNPCFMLGRAQIEIMNYSEDYRITRVPDANYFSYGVKVTAPGGRTAFLAGDINNYMDGDGQGMGDETKLSMQLKGIDFLKMGHHGRAGSNTPSYLKSILRAASSGDRAIAVQTGQYSYMPYETIQALNSVGARHFTVASMLNWGEDAFVVALDADGLKTNVDESAVVVQVRSNAPFAVAYQAGLPVKAQGWQMGSNGKWYYFGDLSAGDGSVEALTNVWVYFFGRQVYVNEKAQITTGWKNIGGCWYLFDSSGTMLTGWQSVGGKWYYLEANGIMATGWKHLGGKWYYLDPSDGAMATGSMAANGRLYYFNDDGSMLSGAGWCQVNGVWFYLDNSDCLKTGWQKLDGTWYYLMPESGAMVTGWAQVGGTWYRMKPSGAMQTGWQKIGGVWYYLKGSGAMATGWQKLDGTWYYLMPESGAMVTGTHHIDGVTYSFRFSGALQ